MSVSFDKTYVKEIRKHFPRIDKDSNGTRRIFIDNGAGSLVLREAARSEYEARINYSANIDAFYSESKGNGRIISEGRKAVSDFLNSPSQKSIYQGDSASELFFKIAYSLRNKFDDSSNVVSSYGEHWANVAPYLELKKDNRLGELRLSNISREDGSIDLNHLGSLVNSKTRLIAITAESNLLGNITDIREISKIAGENGSFLVVDGVHYTPQGHFDVKREGVDFYTFSSYKIFGPRGSFAYVSDKALDEMRPFFVSREALPGHGAYIEVGTRDQGIFSAITAVTDYLSRLSLDLKGFRSGSKPRGRREAIKKGMKRVEAYQRELNRALLEGIDNVDGLPSIKNVVLYGISDTARVGDRGSTFSFNFKNISDRKAEEIYWNKFKITAVGGSHWNLAHDFYSNPSMIRVTFLQYNSMEEVKKFLQATKWIASR